MSQENVDKTRAYIEAYNRRDFETALSDCDPDVEWVLPEHQASDSGVGHFQIRRFWESIDETFDELQLRPQEYVDGGDRVAVRSAITGVARAESRWTPSSTTRSRPSATARSCVSSTWRAGQEALEAAGIDDHPALQQR